MRVVHHNGYRIDDDSRRILKLLCDEPQKITDLKEQVVYDDYRSVSRRLEEHLIPAGLVEEIDEAHHRTVQITDEGRRFMDDNRTRVRSLRDVEHIALNAQNRVDEVEDRLDDLDRLIEHFGGVDQTIESIEQVTDRLDEMDERFAAIEAEQEELHNKADLAVKLAYAAHLELDDKANLDYLHNQITELEVWLSDLEHEIPHLDREPSDSDGKLGWLLG